MGFVDSSALIAAKAKRRDVVRSLRPLVPIILLIVVWTAVVTDPRPGLSGSSLAVSITLGLLVLGGAVAVSYGDEEQLSHRVGAADPRRSKINARFITFVRVRPCVVQVLPRDS